MEERSMMWNLEQKGDSVALVEGDRRLTYARLGELCREIIAPMGDRSLVFSLCTNTAGSVAGYLAFTGNGHVPLLLDAKISRSLLDQLIGAYHPTWIWAPVAMADKLPEGRVALEIEGYELLALEVNTPYAMSADLCLLISTSGSTGSPKLVRQSYENIRSNTLSIIKYLGITASERAITSLPMNYVYGLSVLNTHICAGATLVLTGLNPYAKKFWELVDQEGVTSFAGVPFTYETIDKLRILKREMPSVKTLTQAGGKLSPELHRKLAEWAIEHGKRFVVMYGASEATARMGYLPPERSLEKQGSMGIPIPGGRFELIDADGQVISSAEQVGELVYYGPNVTLGYALTGADLNNPDENRGRLVTGDMAKRDADGYYTIVGRKKRFLKILGKRVNLDDVERLLKQRFDTGDIACGGRDDELWIYVTDPAIEEEAVEYVFTEMDINRKLQKSAVIPAIPRSASQKVLYSQLPPL
jgi:acyl-CoA synthetase (AMP-forming)/AMP-acid ligase II